MPASAAKCASVNVWPPPPSPDRPGGALSIARGRQQFASVGCAYCHTPSLRTANATVAALRLKTASLYSDLALHQMGPGLADEIVQGGARGDEFRTAPLWGLGQRIFFLHDGRTTDLLEAIRAHRSVASFKFGPSEANEVHRSVQRARRGREAGSAELPAFPLGRSPGGGGSGGTASAVCVAPPVCGMSVAPSACGEVRVDYHELAMTALRATVIYVFLLVVLRLLGKRAVGHATAFDFMIALILGEVVDEPIYGDVPLVQGLLVIAVIAGWHAVNSYLSYRSERFDRLAGGSPDVLIKNGVIDRKAMRRERINDEELWTLLRLQQIERIEDVKEATLEPDGELSVIKTDEARELTRGDVAKLLRRVA